MTAAASRVVLTAAPEQARGIVVVLHGGRERSQAPVRGNQLAVLRMALTANRVAAAAGRLVVARVVNQVRGWNGAAMAPVADARAALDELRERFGPDLPICLVGHSLGGRTAMRVADAAGVRSIVGLAPWLPPGEPTAQLRDRQVLILHGTRDRTTSPSASADFARSIARQGAAVSYVTVPGDGHGLMRRRHLVDGLTADFAVATLAGTSADDLAGHRTTSGRDTRLLRSVLAGEPWLAA